MDESAKVREIRLHAVLSLLEKNRAAGTPRPVKAIDLAERTGLHGGHENKRRRVRELVAALHELGERICASSGRPEDCGYWLARDDAEWSAYQTARKAHAKFEFALVGQMHRAANEKVVGQKTLFGNTETPKRRHAGTECFSA